MSFAEISREVLQMSDAQREKLATLLLALRSQRSERWLADMERRRRRAIRGGGIGRGAVLKKHAINETEIAAEAGWWRRGSGS